MPRDLGAVLRMKAARAHGHDHRCSGCHRVPLAGELLHELSSSHSRVCQLCLAELPESKRETIASERVHASDRPLAVAPHAA